MKIRNIALSMMATLWGVASCGPQVEPEQPDDIKTPVIQVAKTEVAIASDGASVDLAYMIDNPVEGQKISVATEADWLTVSTTKARVLTFSADINETGAVRETEVVLSYEGAEDVTVEVSQEFFVNPLKVEISGVSATGVTFSITTSDPELTWIPMVTYKASFEYFDTADELFQNDLEYFAYLADINDLSLAEFIEMMCAVGSMENVTLDGLQPSSDYVLYAYGITMDGRRTTDLVSAPFSTEAPYEGDITFSFNAEENDYILEYTITPSHTGVPYFYGIATAETIDMWKAKNGGNLREAIQNEEIDVEIGELMDMEMISGPDDYYAIYNEANVMDWGYMEMKASTRYVIYACKWDEQCRLTGPVSTFEHTSQAVDPSTNQITLTIENVTQSSVDAVTVTTNQDPYVVMPVKTSEIAGMTDEEIFVYLSSKYDYLMGEYTFNGENVKTFSRMRPGTEYTVVAFGYKAGTMTTAEMDKVDFTTLVAGNPEDCTFEFNVTPDVDFAFVEVTPSDKGQFYHWLVYPSYYTAEEAKYYITQTIEHAYEGDVATFSSWELSLGNDSANAWDLYPATEYKVGAVIMDYDTGEFLSEVFFSEPFTTLEKSYAAITFNFTYGPYYDLGQLINAGQSQFEPCLKDGDAIMPIKLTVDGKCSAFYYTIYANDLMDEEEYPDEIFYAGLEGGGCTKASTNFFVKYDTHMTLTAMAYDYDGNVTKIYRAPLFFTQDGVSPAKDFIASLKKTMKPMSVPAPYACAPSTKRLADDNLTSAQMQMKHDQAMLKVKNLRRENLMKEVMDLKMRKSRIIAK